MVATTVVAGAAPAGAQQFLCNDRVATIVGTNGPDVLRGTDGPDVIMGLGGNDKIFGMDGGDTICGGPGNDRIKGQKGNDYIIGGSGNDLIFGNAGGDEIFGLNGKDIIWGGVGPDVIHAGPDDDTVKAGHGNDVVVGGEGNDVLEGSTGADGLVGETGADTLIGGKGFDTLLGGDGGDFIIGGPGDDFIDAELGRDRCRIDHKDDFNNCEAGNISSESGEGFGRYRTTLSREFELDSPGGPFYVVHVKATPDGTVALGNGSGFRIIMRNANRDVIFDGEFVGDTDHNVLVTGGVPDEVEILAASEWSLSFVKEVAIAPNQRFHVGNSDDVFEIFPSQNGQGQATTIRISNITNNPLPVLIMSVGDIGFTIELDDEIAANSEEIFVGDTRGSTKYIAFYAPKGIIWAWSLDEFVPQGSGLLN